MRSLLFFLAMVCSWALPAQHLIIGDIIDSVRTDSMLLYVEQMSGEVAVDLGQGPVTIASRHSDNPLNAVAQQYYEQKFASWGYTTTAQAFNATGRNVLVTKTGSLYPDEIVILCAHYDALPAGMFNAPAADDDGSGCAAVLEAARILQDIPFERTIVFALWDQEEQGKVGSIYYANSMAGNDENIVGVVNMDAIAWDGNGDKKARVHARPVANSMAIADTMFAILDRYTIDIDLLLTTPGATYSDHASFWSAGYGAVLMIEEFTGDPNPFYHTVNDRVEHFDVPYFEKLAKLSIGSMAALAVPYDPGAAVPERVGRVGPGIYAYPNPATTDVQVWLEVSEPGAYRIEMIDAVGKVVYPGVEYDLSPGKQGFSFDMSPLVPGSYTVVTHGVNGISAAVKVLRIP